MRNRIIKQNQVFMARLEDIPEGFRDTIVRVDGEVSTPAPTPAEPVVEEKKIPTDADPEFFMKLRGGGYYNVVDGNGKILNEKALRKVAAEALIASLQE